MKKLAAFILIALFTQAMADTPPLNTLNGDSSLAPMLEKVMPAVVNITVQGQLTLRSPIARSVEDDQNIKPGPKYREIGSGVIIDAKNGFIITNAHVVQEADLIVVSLSDGRHLRAKLLGKDKASDIAIIQVHSDHLMDIPFGNSDALSVGDFVAAIGNPFGLHQTVTSGVISALNRTNLGIEGYENFIQTDAPINPGNSGGALINLKGELIGMNTAIIGPSGANVGIGFAIPSNMIKSVVNQLIQFGKVRRGVLGVMVQNLNPSLADAFKLPGVKGALVTDVSPNSPAEKAGIQTGDVVTQIDAHIVTNKSQLRNAVGLLPIGSKAKLSILRNNKTITITADIIDPNTMEKAAVKYPLLAGMQIRPYQELDNQSRNIAGLQILQINDGSPAWLASMRMGDIILEVNHKKVKALKDLETIVQAQPNSLLLKIRRQSATVFAVISNQ